MPSPIADAMGVCNFVSLVLLFSIVIGVLVPVLTNTNSLTTDPAKCRACPDTCSVANDCPSILFSSNFNASVDCTAGACIYEFVPKTTPVPIPSGFLGDQYCEQKLLQTQPCFAVASLADCNGMLLECYGGFQCQLA